MDTEKHLDKKKLIATLAVLLVIVVIVAAAKAFSPKDTASSTTSSTANSSENTASTNPSNTDTSASYTDGTYQATADYDTPESVEEIALSVTIKDSIITASSVTSKPTEHESKEYQDYFVAGYKKLVVGKDIDSVQLSRVSGSSLTSQGFNAALEKIKDEAKT